MKRISIISMVLVVFMVCSLVACGSEPSGTASGTTSDTTSGTTSGDATSSNPDAVTTGITLDVWSGQRSNVDSLEENRFTDYYEELTGIKIKWTAYVDNLPEQFNLSIASGVYPDMYINYNFSTQQVQQALDAGAIIPISPYLEEYAPNYSKLLDMDPDMKKEMTTPDGNIYSFPRYFSIDNGYVNSHKLWIFEPWLEASGLPMPTTLDELKQVLIYFRDHDMNGNGKKDEVPMMGSSMILGNASDPMVPVIDCFEIITGNFNMSDNWLKADKDGNITIMADTDNYREGLKYANTLFDEGLCSSETYTLNVNDWRSITSVTSADQNICGVTGGPDYARFVTAASADRYKNWTSIPLLKKDANSEPQTLLQPRPYVLKSMVTTKTKYPEACVKWQDMGFDPLLQITSAFGYENEHWTRISESPETGIVFELTDKSLYAGGAATQAETWSMDWWEFPTYQGAKYRPFTQQFKEGTDVYLQYTKQTAANKSYEPYGVFSGIPYGNIWCTDNNLINDWTSLGVDINTFISQSYAEFITGKKDINDDAAWKAYTDQLKAMGVDRFCELSEEYYFGK